MYRYGGSIGFLVDFVIVASWLFDKYRHNTLTFSRTRFSVVMIFLSLMLFHTALTGFLEAVRPGHIPTLYYRHHMIQGAYAMRVQHLVYGSNFAIMIEVIKGSIAVIKCWMFAEILREDRDYTLLRGFTWGNMAAIPFIFASFAGRSLFGGMRFSPISSSYSGRSLDSSRTAICFTASLPCASLYFQVQEAVQPH